MGQYVRVGERRVREAGVVARLPRQRREDLLSVAFEELFAPLARVRARRARRIERGEIIGQLLEQRREGPLVGKAAARGLRLSQLVGEEFERCRVGDEGRETLVVGHVARHEDGLVHELVDDRVDQLERRPAQHRARDRIVEEAERAVQPGRANVRVEAVSREIGRKALGPRRNEVAAVLDAAHDRKPPGHRLESIRGSRDHDSEPPGISPVDQVPVACGTVETERF